MFHTTICVYLLVVLSLSRLNADENSGNTVFTVDLLSFGGSQYYISIDIGESGQKFNLQVALATNWLWIPNQNCACEGRNSIFVADSSSSYTGTQDKYTIAYAIGSIQGVRSYEKFFLNQAEMPNTAFLLCQNKEKLYHMASDGVLGLGYPQDPENSQNFLVQMQQKSLISEKIFGIYIPHNKNKDQTGKIYFGGYSEDLTTGGKTVVKAYTDKGLWTIKANYIGFGDKYFSVKPNVHLDTGTNVIKGQKKVVNEIKKYLKKTQSCYYDNFLYCKCTEDNISLFPKFSFDTDGVYMEIAPENYLEYENGKCKVLIQNSEGDDWIFGVPFFKEFYSVFSVENSEIYLYKQVGESVFMSYSNEIFIICGILIALFIQYRGVSGWKNNILNSHYQLMSNS